MNLFIASCIACVLVAYADSHPTDADAVTQGFRDVAPSGDEGKDADDSDSSFNFEDFGLGSSSQSQERYKRSAEGELQAFRDRVLEKLNDYRAEIDLTQLVVDPALEQGAQNWADDEALDFEMRHSCEDCPDYSEILAKRRSSRVLPTGDAAGDWVYSSWFEDEDRTYAILTDDPNIHTVGFGVAFARNPADRTYHAYAVARFARGH